MEKNRDYYTLKRFLLGKGYTTPANDDWYLGAVLEYLEMCPETYTIFDWFQDTLRNYPEDLI